MACNERIRDIQETMIPEGAGVPDLTSGHQFRRPVANFLELLLRGPLTLHNA